MPGDPCSPGIHSLLSFVLNMGQICDRRTPIKVRGLRVTPANPAYGEREACRPEISVVGLVNGYHPLASDMVSVA